MKTIHDWIIHYQAFIREDINGAGMVLCASLTIMIFMFMVNGWYEATKRSSFPFSNWSHMPGVPMACALLWVFGAETYRTGAIWHIYHFSSDHTQSAVGSFAEVTFWPTLGYLVAGIILIFALIRCTFLFAPPTWRKHVWVCSLLTSLGFVLLSHLSR
jgi:hypothetical protein